jgi:hypothetical protein
VNVEHRTTVAMVWGTTPPVRAVYCDPDGDPPGQRWFSVVLDDAGEPDDGPDEVPVCAHCLLDEYPELGRGFDLALAVKGEVELDAETGEWRPTPDVD